MKIANLILNNPVKIVNFLSNFFGWVRIPDTWIPDDRRFAVFCRVLILLNCGSLSVSQTNIKLIYYTHNILWHVDSLLGNDHRISKNTTSIIE